MKKKLLIGMMAGAGAFYLYKKMNPDMMHDMKKKVKDTCEMIINVME
ncbi:MAG: hypothetical protein IK997_03165 [Bacilli bacterium]|nr:hypothetical protein [Bacilli bacterium]